MNSSTLKNKALACFRNNQLAEAKSLYTEACRLSPKDADIWHMLSGINGMMGLYADSESCAKKTIKLRPNAVSAHNNLGAALLAQNKLDKARHAFQKALKLEPNNPDALNNTGNIYLKLKDYKTASAYYKKAIAAQPLYAEAYNNLASALLHMDKTDEALTHLQKTLQINPHYPDALYNYGQALQVKEQYDKAMTAYRHAIEIQGNHSDAILGLADILKTQGKYSEATELYESALNINSQHVNALTGLGLIKQKINNHSDALKYLERAIKIDSKRADILHYIGSSYKELGEYECASGYFKRALKVDPDFVQAEHMLASMGKSPTPDKADARYVASLFDEYAEQFDNHLVKGLEYRTPTILGDILSPLLGAPEKSLDILDLGCGTGLCAPIFQQWSCTLVGVDLSEKMIDKARKLGLYSRLVVGDLLPVLEEASNKYDLIIAADVFVYLGKLDAVVNACSSALRPGGTLGFSVELLENCDEPYKLHTGGRYAHTLQYIQSLADKSTFEIRTVKETILRKEKGTPVCGLIFSFQHKP